MAITAAITVASATASTGQKVACTCTVTNTGGSTVYVTSCVPSAARTGSTQSAGTVNLGMPNLGPGMTTAVAGSSGTLGIKFDAVAMAPQVGNYTSNPFPSAGVGGVAISPLPPEAMAQSLVYDIGAIVTTSDGSVTSATTTTLTVAAVTA